jgi:Xaa-Pro aminopeptidase
MPLSGAAMATNSLSPHPARVRTLQADLGAAQLDALVVTHLPNLRYVTGFSGTAGAAVLTPGRCVLIVDFRYATSARELIATQPDGFLDLVIVESTYDDTLADVLRRTAAARIGVEGASMTVNRFRKLADALTPHAGRDVVTENAVLVPTDRFIERRRAVKDTAEIETLRLAARLLSRVTRQVPSFVRVGRSELEIAADIDAALRAGGFERPAFDTIVASGPNGAHPHARPGRRIVATGDGVVLDFGGVYDGYCVDLTRTLQVGAASPDLRRLFDAVRRAHAAAIAAVKPGTRPSDIDRAARTVLTDHGLGDAFGHGTGHGLGLEVHEDPRISKLPGALPDDPVVPGMVFTIEPGAYVEGLGGVRIEDDVLVTRDGCEVLTDVPIEYE